MCLYYYTKDNADIFMVTVPCFCSVQKVILKYKPDTMDPMHHWEQKVPMVENFTPGPFLCFHFLQRAQCSHCKRCISYFN